MLCTGNDGSRFGDGMACPRSSAASNLSAFSACSFWVTPHLRTYRLAQVFCVLMRFNWYVEVTAC